MEQKYFYTTKEIAQILHCSTHYVTTLRRTGWLRGTRVGRNWLYDVEALESFINNVMGKDVQGRIPDEFHK